MLKIRILMTMKKITNNINNISAIIVVSNIKNKMIKILIRKINFVNIV